MIARALAERGRTEVLGDEGKSGSDDGGVEGLQREWHDEAEDDLVSVHAPPLLLGSLLGRLMVLRRRRGLWIMMGLGWRDVVGFM